MQIEVPRNHQMFVNARALIWREAGGRCRSIQRVGGGSPDPDRASRALTVPQLADPINVSLSVVKDQSQR